MSHIEYINTEWQLFPAPEPIWDEMLCGLKGRKWTLKFISNDPHHEQLRIVGKRYVDGVHSSDYIQYL